MELNPRQQKLAFAIIVVMLAGLGVYLLLPQAKGGPDAAASRVSSAPPAAPPTIAAPATTPPPAVTPSPVTSGTVNIFQWLPFTPEDLGRAASVATQAAAYYDTFRYDETAASYGNRLSSLVTSQYLASLEDGYSTYGVARQRNRDKEISTATATIDSLRAFDSSSITFVVTINQHMRKVSGTTSATGQFAITVVSVGGTWQVNQIQPASAGNQ